MGSPELGDSAGDGPLTGLTMLRQRARFGRTLTRNASEGHAQVVTSCEANLVSPPNLVSLMSHSRSRSWAMPSSSRLPLRWASSRFWTVVTRSGYRGPPARRRAGRAVELIDAPLYPRADLGLFAFVELHGAYGRDLQDQRLVGNFRCLDPGQRNSVGSELDSIDHSRRQGLSPKRSFGDGDESTSRDADFPPK
jgi:hypothetical protein